MFKTLISAITGISEERYNELSAEIERLTAEINALKEEIQHLDKQRDSLRSKSLELSSRDTRSFLTGSSVFIGENNAGHGIYEIRLDGIDVPIRTKIDDR